MTASQARSTGLPLINFLRLKGVPILQQLHLEERLLRTSSDNWCIINDGTTRPTIVMGVSGFEINRISLLSSTSVCPYHILTITILFFIFLIIPISLSFNYNWPFVLVRIAEVYLIWGEDLNNYDGLSQNG